MTCALISDELISSTTLSSAPNATTAAAARGRRFPARHSELHERRPDKAHYIRERFAHMIIRLILMNATRTSTTHPISAQLPAKIGKRAKLISEERSSAPRNRLSKLCTRPEVSCRCSTGRIVKRNSIAPTYESDADHEQRYHLIKAGQ